MVDEFEVFRARAFGCRETDDTVADDVTDDDDEYGKRRQRRSQRRHDSERTNSDSSMVFRKGQHDGDDDGRESEDGHHGRQWTNRRQRLNTQITVSVEPPSPTELFPVHRTSGDGAEHAHQSAYHRTRHRSREENEQEDSTESRGIHRTRTMPARRTRSPSAESGSKGSPKKLSDQNSFRASNSHDAQHRINGDQSLIDQAPNLDVENGNGYDNCDDDDCAQPAEPEVECKVYRVRSFTTKKGGSFVNRGDSIKVCSRRGSRQDVMLLTAHSGEESALHRRNSTSGLIGNGNRSRRGSSIVLQQDLVCPGLTALQRRNSINCIGLQLMTSDAGSSSAGRRSIAPSAIDLSTIAIDGCLATQPTGSARRASLRISPSANGNDVLIVSQTSPSRRSSIMIAASEFFGTASAEPETEIDGEHGGGNGKLSGIGHVTEIFRVLVLGSHGVGKTTLTQQLQTSEYLANSSEMDQDDDATDHVVSVRLDDVESMVHFIDNHNPDVELHDNCREVSDTVGSIDAFLVVYSVTDKSSFIYAQSCLQDIKRQRLLADGVSALLVANKQDLVRNRIVTESEGKRLGSKRHCKYIEVSALLDHKVDDVLVTIIRQTRQRKEKAGCQLDDCGTRSSHDRPHLMGCFQRASVAFCRKLFK